MNTSADENGHQAVIADLLNLSQYLADSSAISLQGPDRICCTQAGRVRVYAVSDTATAGSSGVAYHIVKILRNGQDETGVGLDTRVAEIAAYTTYSLGSLAVSAGTVLKVSVSVTGAPAPTLSTANFSLRCDLTPRG